MVLILSDQKGGPACRYCDSDVLFLLDYLSKGRKAGRGKIAKYLGIGEGSVRNLLDILASHELIGVRQSGVTIEKSGKELLLALGIESIDLTIPAYVLGKCQQAVIVRDASERVFNGIEQRNAGIRAGGDGCTTWVMEKGRIIMLPNWDMDEHEPQFASMIRRRADMRDGDVLIIGGGSTRHSAMMAAGEAALQLI